MKQCKKTKLILDKYGAKDGVKTYCKMVANASKTTGNTPQVTFVHFWSGIGQELLKK